MEPRVRVISFHSTDGYAEQAQNLRESADKYSVELVQSPVSPFANWEQGVMYKPQFIQEALNGIRYLGYDGVLWTDADSVFVRPVPWGDLEGVQVGYTSFQWSPSHAVETLTGTVYFANDDKVRAMVDEWVRETPKYGGSDTPEQMAFRSVLGRWKGHILTKELGCEWCFIDDPAVFKLYPKSIPIVLHKQYSRTFRRQELNRAVKK